MEAQTWVGEPAPNPKLPLPGRIDCLCMDRAQGMPLCSAASICKRYVEEPDSPTPPSVVSKSVPDSHSPPGQEGKDFRLGNCWHWQC